MIQRSVVSIAILLNVIVDDLFTILHMSSWKVVMQQINRCKQFLIINSASTSRTTTTTTYRSLHKGRGSTWRASVEEELTIDFPKEANSVCIYKIPPTMYRPETRAAFEPNIVSVGPYHHGVARLQAMEKIKRQVVHRIFSGNRDTLDSAMEKVESFEERARNCYSERITLSRDRFLKMMLIDGCFVNELLRESAKLPCFDIERWMQPALRRDLIMLENQLPLFALKELFDVTKNISNCSSLITLEELAFFFLRPLLQGHSNAYSNCYKEALKSNNNHDHEHLLDLVRSVFLPPAGSISRGNQIHMIRSMSDLKAAGIKVKAGRSLRPLEISLTKMSKFGGKLMIPQLYLDDRRGTLFRNLIAFEKCHRKCSPDVTSYLFFFDGLINSAKDVELLHYSDVLHHSFGSDSEVANFINNLCKEIGHDASQSYLHGEVEKANSYYRSFYGKLRASLVRHYLTSWVVGVSTLAAVLAFYLTLIQTTTGIHGTGKDLGFFQYVLHPFYVPARGKLSSNDKAESM